MMLEFRRRHRDLHSLNIHAPIQAHPAVLVPFVSILMPG
jgi:hypothetical protein